MGTIYEALADAIVAGRLGNELQLYGNHLLRGCLFFSKALS